MAVVQRDSWKESERQIFLEVVRKHLNPTRLAIYEDIEWDNSISSVFELVAIIEEAIRTNATGDYQPIRNLLVARMLHIFSEVCEHKQRLCRDSLNDDLFSSRRKVLDRDTDPVQAVSNILGLGFSYRPKRCG